MKSYLVHKNSIKASKTELLNKSNSISPCFTARSSQMTLMSSLCWYIKSLLYNCHTSLPLTPPRSRKETFKSTLQNCAEWPIGEYIREKYTPFLATNLTTLLTLFEQLDRIASITQMRPIATNVARSVVCVSVHTDESSKNGWTDRDAIWITWIQGNMY